MNYYELLEISPNASKEVIEMAYKALAKKYHPDLNPYEHREKCEEYMKALNEAKNILLDDNLRFEYDEFLKMKNSVFTASSITHDGTTNVNENDLILYPRPWVRFFARSVDMYLGTMIISYSWLYASPITYYNFITTLTPYVASILIYAVWLVIESLILSSTGTTLGKCLLNTKIEYETGGKLTYKNALIRSFNIFTKGMWLSIPILCYIAMILSYNTLKNTNALSWDTISCSKVTHKKLNPFKVIILILLFALIAFFKYK